MLHAMGNPIAAVPTPINPPVTVPSDQKPWKVLSIERRLPA